MLPDSLRPAGWIESLFTIREVIDSCYIPLSFLWGSLWIWDIFADFEIGEIIANALVAPVLFVDLEDPGVLSVVGRENTRFLTL